MIRDITLGQYFPSDTIVHRLDPRIKLIITVLYIASLFCAKGVTGYLIMLAWLTGCILLSEINLRVLTRGLRPLLFIMIFTGVLNIFYTPGVPIFQWGFLKVTQEGIVTAVFMVARIIMLVIGTFLLTYTTSPIMLTDAIERLLKPLALIRVPVHDLAMMMTIALRFIPTLIDETDKIMSAQKARGADFESGGIIRRAKALIPILVPLFISAFRRAEELAIAMECRCYRGGEGRTKMRELRLQARDFMALAVSLIVLAAVIFAGLIV